MAWSRAIFGLSSSRSPPHSRGAPIVPTDDGKDEDAGDAPADTWYVPPTGDDDAEGRSSETAFRTIARAVASAGPTGYVLEGNIAIGNLYGVYLWNFGTTDLPAADIVSVADDNEISGNTNQDWWIQAQNRAPRLITSGWRRQSRGNERPGYAVGRRFAAIASELGRFTFQASPNNSRPRMTR